MPSCNLPIHGEHVARKLKLDCRHYRGDRPCAAGIQGVCPTACEHYDPMGTRILIIKLAALGDVIRTAALLPGIKRAWPQSHVTWVSRPNGVRMLAHHPLIDRLLPFGAESICHLEYERFDLCLSLDKEPGPAALAMRVDARERRGIGLSATGAVYPLNPECGHYFELGLDDTLKFHENTKTYQRLIYEALGLEYRGEKYELHPADADRRRAARVWERLGVGPDERVVGLNTGAGHVFANKSWLPEKFARFARQLTKRCGCRVALLGGPGEASINRRLAAENSELLDTGTDHVELTFAAILERCDALVTGDTMALHVAVALDVPCVALFGPTCAQEIDLYGRGTALRTSLACSPCYRRSCDVSPNCMEDIPIADALAAVEHWLGTSTRRRAKPTFIAEPVV